MSRGVQRCRLDNNHRAICDALRAAGMEVRSTAMIGSGFADIVVGWRGINTLLEIKSGTTPSERALTAAEQDFHTTWPGQVAIVSTPEEAVLAVIEHARNCGVPV